MLTVYIVFIFLILPYTSNFLHLLILFVIPGNRIYKHCLMAIISMASDVGQADLKLAGCLEV